MLTVHELSKSYNSGLPALNFLTFTLLPGEILCLAGPNGSGKTTTLRLLASLIKPSSGSIRFNDLAVHYNDLDFKTKIGYLPEKCGFYHRFSGRWNLEFYSSLFNKKLEDSDITSYVKLLDFEKYFDKPVGTYSSGTKQKLGILRTLSISPIIFLFDEPLNGLDIESQYAVKQILKKLANEKKLILISTHLISTIEDILDRVIILFEGKKITDIKMAMIQNILDSKSKCKSIIDFYLAQIAGAKYEVK